MRWDIQEEEDGDKRHAANGQVDVKAPPPRYVCRETTANNGTGNGGNAHEHTHQALQLRALVKGNHVNQGGDLVSTQSIFQHLKRRQSYCGELTIPAKIPAAPIPEIALPMMKAREVGAAPAITDATSKMITLIMRTCFRGHNVYSLPNSSCSAQHVNKYEPPYQPTSSKELNSLVMCGMAVAMIVRSSETRKTTRKIASIRRTNCRAGFSDLEVLWAATWSDELSPSLFSVSRVVEGPEDVSCSVSEIVLITGSEGAEVMSMRKWSDARMLGVSSENVRTRRKM